MEIKHKRVFQPVAIDLWELRAVEKEFRETANFINLYSTHRGTNRFQGLIMVFEKLRRNPALARHLPDPSALREFVLSGRSLSVDALEEYAGENPSPILAEAASWSRRSDELYERITREEGNLPYPLVRECLERAAQSAEVRVISSASRAGLEHDWGRADLLGHVGPIAGQEAGDKKTQLAMAIGTARAADRSLMIGDAPGDLEAAHATGTLFFPVLPGKEKQSWEQLHHEGLDRFFGGTFAGEYQEGLLARFRNALHEDAPWP